MACSEALERVDGGEEVYYSSHSVGLVNCFRLQCARGCSITWSSAKALPGRPVTQAAEEQTAGAQAAAEQATGAAGCADAGVAGGEDAAQQGRAASHRSGLPGGCCVRCGARRAHEWRPPARGKELGRWAAAQEIRP